MYVERLSTKDDVDRDARKDSRLWTRGYKGTIGSFQVSPSATLL